MKRLATITAAFLVSTTVFAQQEQPSVELDAEPHLDRVTIDNELFTQLIRGQTEAFGKTPQPYFYPIVGPTGAQMTRNYPMVRGVEGEADDHPHHRSLWFAHGNVNGVDFWHAGKGTIVSGKPLGLLNNALGPNGIEGPSVSFQRTDTWVGPDEKEVLTNTCHYSFEVLDDGARVINIAHHLTPAKGADKVTFGDTKEGAMALRVHPALRLKGEVATGKAINSNGDKDAKVWGKRAKWVAYWGVIDGKTCGVAIFDHPTNLRHPTWWHARDYGLVAANPFGMTDFEKGKHKRGAGEYTLKQGETLELQYRFVFFAGTAEEADIAGKYDAWVKETTQDHAVEE